MRSSNALPYWFLFLLALTTVAVFWPIYNGNFTLGNDAADLLMPTLSHIRSSLLQGHFSYWNPFQLQGLDTTIFPPYWNPLFLLCALLFPSPATALGAIYLTLLFIGGIGFFKLTGVFTSKKETPLVGGLSFPLLSLFVVSGTDLGIVAIAAFLPGLTYVNHRYHATSQWKYLLLLVPGMFLLSTMASIGFVLYCSLFLLVQGWFTSTPECRIRALTNQIAWMALGGLLVGKITWERAGARSPLTDSTHDVFHTFHDLLSFLLPQTKSMPAEFAGVNGPASFHHYIGIILLAWAGINLVTRPSRKDVKMAVFAILCLGAANLGTALEPAGPSFSGMTGYGFAAIMKLLLTGMVLLLALRGFEKAIDTPTQVRYVFLGLSMIGAGGALYVQNLPEGSLLQGLTAWILELDAWKIAFLGLLTALVLWLRNRTLRWVMVAIIMVTDLGINNYLIQDTHLLHEYPNSDFESLISYPEDRPARIDLTASLGQWSDEDFTVGGLDRNTGTLTKQIVRDGFWPWNPASQQSHTSGQDDSKHRYPLFYFTRDTTGQALPTAHDFNNDIQILHDRDHQWHLSIDHQFEKYLVFNQNFHRNWTAEMDGERFPIYATRAGTMMIPVKPGTHTISFEFRPDGLTHVFGFTMIMCCLILIYLIYKRQFPVYAMGCALPILIMWTFHFIRPLPQISPITGTDSKNVDYAMNYETLPPKWFLRGEQIHTDHSRSGFRSEHLSAENEYSATLRLDSTDLRDVSVLGFRFFIRSEEEVKFAIVLKTYGTEDPLHNIEYFRAFNRGDWIEMEGRFSLEDQPKPLKMAEWYIWNNEQEDFLIDDIEIKLNP